MNSAISQELGLLLRIRQQRLLNFQYHSSSISAGALVPMADEVSHVTCLHVALGTMQDYQTARLLVDRMTSVTRLTITMDCRTTLHSIHIAACHEVVNTMLASGTAFRQGGKLRRLRLQGMESHKIGKTLPTILPFNDLTHLHLDCCSSTNVLCGTLSQLNLNLQSFRDEYLDNMPRPGAVDGFLRSLSPLRQSRIHAHRI